MVAAASIPNAREIAVTVCPVRIVWRHGDRLRRSDIAGYEITKRAAARELAGAGTTVQRSGR